MTPPLIVGAGPTGLAAALFLAERGIEARIVDEAERPSPYSKALAVNPRTLELLEASGVTERMLAEGRRVRAGCFWHEGRLLVRLDLPAIRHRHPFLLVLPQARSEALIAEALGRHGLAPERGVALESLEAEADGVRARLAGSSVEEVSAPLVLGADGAHSRVRHSLGIDFPGTGFVEPWRLYDMVLHTPLATDSAHIVLLDGGFLFLLAIDDEVWRVLGNVPDPLAHLPEGSVPGEIRWQSDFRISHRVAARFAEGRVCLAGDAAHIHSPAGARGMNLGIEDAYVFAAAAAEALAGRVDRLAEYGRLRHAVDSRVVHRIEALTRVVRGASATTRLLRERVLPLAVHLPFARQAVLAQLTGLDHALQLV